MNITIVGTGYVGLTTGVVLALTGNKVKCLDVDPRKIELINQGKSHFYEPGLDSLVKNAIDSGNFSGTLDYKEALKDTELAFICVGTPARADGSAELKYLESSIKSIAENFEGKELIIAQKSTVPVGTGRKMLKLFKEYAPIDLKVCIVSCPEFLREGSAVYDTIFFDRLVVGADHDEDGERAKAKIIALYQQLDEYAQGFRSDAEMNYILDYVNNNANIKGRLMDFEKRIITMSLESAELTKITANAFLATKISFANFIANLSDAAGANVTEVMDGVGADLRIGRSFLYAGIGYGGGCFPKDVASLISTAESFNVDPQIINAVRDVNYNQVTTVAQKIRDILSNGNEEVRKRVTILGLSFKPGTDDVRESPALALIRELQKDKFDIVAYDPQANEESQEIFPASNTLTYASSIDQAVKDSDVVVITTDWNEFKKLDFSILTSNMRSLNLVDARNIFKRRDIEELGFKYTGIGQ